MTRTAHMPKFGFPSARAGSETLTPAAASGPPVSDGFAWIRNLGKSLANQSVSQKQLLVITQQLAVMLASGCDLCAGLEAMSRQQGHPYLRAILSDLHDSVKSGHSFSQALARHPDVFNQLYVTMIRAGESAGLLKGMLQGLQTLIRNQIRIASQVRTAMMYPSILMGVALTAIVVMTTFVLPKFAAIFKASRVPLPASTAFVLSCAEWLGRNWMFVIPSVIAAVVLLVYALHHPAIRRSTHAWALRLPLIGPALRLSYCVRSVQTMGLLSKSGLPLAECIHLTRDMMPNIYYWEFFDELHNHISEGKGISQHFDETTLFPPMVAQMVAVGEQTGTLANVCMEVAAYHEEELAARIKVLTTALEPMIIVLMGGFVGFIAVSVILPLFRISSAVH